MLLLGSSFAKMPILSLRVGGPIGRVVGHLINPHKLRIDGLWCQIGGFKNPQMLLPADIREIGPRGIIVDDRNVIVPIEEIIRLKPIIDLKFELLEKKVLSGRSSLGKLADYAVDRDSFLVQKLYVTPGIFGRINTTRLTIDRSQVIEVSPDYVRVTDGAVKAATTQNQPAIIPAYSASTPSASLIEE